jgi:glycosyltransferase involved in cell wall biosynthesis
MGGERLFFYCNAVGDDVRTLRRLHGDSPAGTRKVVGLCKACRAAGIDAQIVSMGRGRVGGFGFFGTHKSDIDGVPVIYGPMLHIRMLSYVASAVWIAWIAFNISLFQRKSVHLFYNQLTFYIGALAILRIFRQRVFVDIEDGPIPWEVRKNDSFKVRKGANVSPRMFARFINGGALLANRQLAGGTTIRPCLEYYGAIPGVTQKIKRQSSEINILVSGTIEPATGIGILIDAIGLLVSSPLLSRIRFTITGQGSMIEELVAFAQAQPAVSIRVLGRVSFAEYAKCLDDADVGLSLRLFGHEYSVTTFPSKTIEYAESGLLIISTDISDVRAIFADAAWYLTANDPQQLADLIVKAAANPAEVRDCGRRAQQIVDERLSFETAGARLRDFFFDGTASST